MRLTMYKRHPIIVGLLVAFAFSFIISIGYIFVNGVKANPDLFSGLSFIVEQKRFFSDWSTFFSEPFFVADSNFFVVVHLVVFAVSNNILFSYKLYTVLLLAASFFSMYSLAYFLSDKNKILSGIVAGIFYSLTPYFLLELVGHIYMMWAYALLPLAYLSIHKAIINNNQKAFTWTCIAGIFIALSSFYPMIQYVYINGVFLVLFSVLLCFKDVNRNKLKQVLHRLIRVFLFFLIAFLLSAYFLLPMFFQQSPFSIGFTFGRELLRPTFSNTAIESAFLLNRGFSVDLGLPGYFNIYGAIMLPFALPLVFGSFLMILKKKSVYFLFFLLGILGIFFAMGSNAPPFLRLFDYLEALPYADLIRTPCRFTLQVALSFSLLAGIAIGEIVSSLCRIRPVFSKKIRHNYKMWLGLLTLFIIIISYLFSGYTVLHSAGGPFETKQISDTASEVVKWLDKNDPNQNYRIIDLTPDLQLEGYHRSLARVEGDLVSRYYRSPSFARILGLLNVKYLIAYPDWGRPFFYWHAYINDVLSYSQYFESAQINDVTIYINKLAKPRIYASYGAISVGGPSALSTFNALAESKPLVDNTINGFDITFNSGWNAVEIVNTASHGYEPYNGTVSDFWINTTQSWQDYVGYRRDGLEINPNATQYLVLRLKNDDNPASATSVHLFDDLDNRFRAVDTVHFSDWTTVAINLTAYTQRPIKRITIYVIEQSNVANVKLHTYLCYMAFLNESFKPSILNDDWALFGTDLLSEEDNSREVSKFDALIFHDSDLFDLTFLHLDPVFKLEAWKYLNNNWKIVEDQHGSLPSAASYQSSVSSQLVLSERAIYTDAVTELVAPFSTANSSSYDVWFRACNAVPIDWVKGVAALPPNVNVVSASIDGIAVGKANIGKVGGFKWTKINDEPLLMSKGQHSLSLLTDGHPVYLDMIAVTPSGLVNSTLEREMAYAQNLNNGYLLEFSNYFAGENAVRDVSTMSYTSDAWSGYLTLGPNSSIAQNLFIAKDGNYAIGLRLLPRSGSGVLDLRIDGLAVLSALRRGDNEVVWLNAESVFLSAGQHSINVESEGGYNSIDFMYVIEDPLLSNSTGVSNLLQYDQVQFSTWQGKLSSSKPTFIILTESNYPEWVLQLQTEKNKVFVEPMQVFYFLNAYYINSTSNVQFTIYHQTSQVRIISYALSISAFFACITVIIVENVLKKRKLRGLEGRFKVNPKSTSNVE